MGKRLIYVGDIVRRAFKGRSRPQATLHARLIHPDGTIEDKGLVATKAITDAWMAHLVDVLQAADTTFSDYKYHDSGTGTTAAVVGDTALETPCGEARTVGTQVEGAAANIYKTVATHTYAGNFTITEHGLLNAAAVGTLADRSVFTGIDVVANDRIEWTYEATFPSGG